MNAGVVQDPADQLAVEYHFGMLGRDPNPAERAYADALVRAIADAARDGRATWEASWEQARAAARNEPTPPLAETGEPDLACGARHPCGDGPVRRRPRRALRRGGRRRGLTGNAPAPDRARRTACRRAAR